MTNVEAVTDAVEKARTEIVKEGALLRLTIVGGPTLEDLANAVQALAGGLEALHQALADAKPCGE
jgi:DNA-binding FrmR family transcriptional regulator